MPGRSPVCRGARCCHAGGEGASPPLEGDGSHHSHSMCPRHPPRRYFQMASPLPHLSTCPGCRLTRNTNSPPAPGLGNPTGLLCAALPGGHTGQRARLGSRQADRQTDDLTAGKLSQRFIRFVCSCETLQASEEAFNS